MSIADKKKKFLKTAVKETVAHEKSESAKKEKSEGKDDKEVDGAGDPGCKCKGAHTCGKGGPCMKDGKGGPGKLKNLGKKDLTSPSNVIVDAAINPLNYFAKPNPKPPTLKDARATVDKGPVGAFNGLKMDSIKRKLAKNRKK